MQHSQRHNSPTPRALPHISLNPYITPIPMASTSSRSSKLSFLLRRPVVVDMGCSCRKAKLFSLFSPKPRKHLPSHPTPKHYYFPLSPSNATTTTATTVRNSSLSSSTTTTTTTASSSSPPEICSRRRRVEGVAVVKESRDPYRDFQDSMISMILEKEIYEWDDLCSLLHHFLVLNYHYHHDAIIRAFTEILDGPMDARGATAHRRRRHGRRTGTASYAP